jgi:hypothetical protein
MTSKPFTREGVKRACEELAEMGLLEDTGLRRNGQVVWRVSSLGKLYSDWKDIVKSNVPKIRTH